LVLPLVLPLALPLALPFAPHWPDDGTALRIVSEAPAATAAGGTTVTPPITTSRGATSRNLSR
jgi:hypothetical protein